MDDEAAMYLAGGVIEQAVRDWRLARRAGLIKSNGLIDRNAITKYYRNSSNTKLPTGFDGPAEVESLVKFFNNGGLEAWINFAGLQVDPDLIMDGLDASVQRRRQNLHSNKLRPPSKESI